MCKFHIAICLLNASYNELVNFFFRFAFRTHKPLGRLQYFTRKQSEPPLQEILPRRTDKSLHIFWCILFL